MTKILTDSIIPNLKSLTEVKDTGWIPLALYKLASPGSISDPYYRKITIPSGGGVVYLRGTIKDITWDEPEFAILPAGFRPPENIYVLVPYSAAVGSSPRVTRLSIINNGVCKIEDMSSSNLGNPPWISIDCSFLVD